MIFRPVVILGGGVAGMAAAVRLREVGVSVSLVESTKRLGGRASSVFDPTLRSVVDLGQHVLMPCCTELIDFLTRIGTIDLIEWHDELHFMSRPDRVETITGFGRSGPFRFLAQLMGLRLWSCIEKIIIARGLAAVWRAGRGDENQPNGVTMARWLRDHDQTDSVIRRFWDVVIQSTCNAGVDRVDASIGLKVFQDGFFDSTRSFKLGSPSGPLVDLFANVPALIDDLRLGRRVVRLCGGPDGVRSVVLDDGSEIDAEVVISALPYQNVLKISEPNLIEGDEGLGGLSGLRSLRSSPILNVVFVFNSPVMDHSHLAVLDHRIHWVFADERGRRLHVVISAADEWMRMRESTIVRELLSELHCLLPRSSESALLGVRVMKSRRATFVPSVESVRSRPSVTGRVGNLLLAGDYVNTGWPATMEGAVRSGRAAAEAALKLLGLWGGP